MNSFEKRLAELGEFSLEMEPQDLWVLIARAQLVEGGSSWLSKWLWDYRYCKWVVSLEDRSCMACGASLRFRRGDARFCDEACAQQARRARNRNPPHRTTHKRRIDKAASQLEEMESELFSFREWHRRTTAFVLPPDLLSIDHLPVVPKRCGGGCTPSSVCTHTGGVCFFAGTRGGGNERGA